MSQNAQCSKVAVKGLDLCLDTDDLNIPSPESIREMIREEGVAGGAGINYSLEEQWTGLRWIDGSKIYQKTILLPDMTSARIDHTHGIPGLKMVISSEAYGIGRLADRFQPIPYANAYAISASIEMGIKKDVIYMVTNNSDMYTREAHLTIRYTRKETN